MKYYLDSSDLKKLKELYTWYMRSKNSNIQRRRPRLQGGGGGTSVRRAKIQTSGVGSSSLSCKLLDADGNEISTGGDNDDGVYTVYPVEHLGTNNLSGNVWPKLAANDIISVFLDVNGNYYTTFIFDDTDTC